MDSVGEVLALMDTLPDDDWTDSLDGAAELPGVVAAVAIPDELLPSLAGHLLERIVSLGWAWIPESTRGRVERRLLSAIARRPRRWALEDVEMLLGLGVRIDSLWRWPDLLDLPVGAVEAYCIEEPIGRLEPLVRHLLESLDTPDPRLATEVRARLRRRLRSVLGARVDAPNLALFEPTDGWGLAMREWLEGEALPAAPTNALLSQFATATTVNPTAKWQKACVRLLADHSQAERLIRAMLDAAFAHTGRRSNLQSWEMTGEALVPENAALIRGAIWGAEVLRPAWTTEVIGRVGLHYGTSPNDNNVARDEKVASTCAALLGRLDGDEAASALGRMKAIVRSRAVLKQVDAALAATSERTGTPIWQLLESAVPTFGLDEDGRRTVVVGQARAEVSVDDEGTVSVTWRTSERATRRPPASIATSSAPRVAILKAETKEIEKTLVTERLRLEALLIAPRSWTATAWRDRYLGHPLTRPWTRRLLWQFEDAASRQVGMPIADTIEGLHGPIAVGADATVRPWHPIVASAAEVEAWRDWLLDRRVRQPFKQAFREVYRLAPQEAERSSSGRFAGHVLHYPQASALMSVRRWSANQLGFWDGGYDGIAKRTFESHAIRAEFEHQLARDEASIEKQVEEREARLARPPASDGLEDLVARLVEAARSHSALPIGAGYEDIRYCRSGDVRFFRAADRESSEPLALREVPAEVFSEAMRDVDLFVSVSSVAIDQLWRDLDEPRISLYRDLSAFAVLPESAHMRRDVLRRLIPRSRIADRCSVEGRYLRVRGDRRTYQIHLGSAQVLMEPNDQHLFIRLPKPDAAEVGGVFMPFDDTLLGHVLAKAFLLADDTKIRDPAIRRQIDGTTVDRPAGD